MSGFFASTKWSDRVGLFMMFTVSIWCLLPYQARADEKGSTPISTEASTVLKKNLDSAVKEKQKFENYVRTQLKLIEDKVEALREKSSNLHETTKSQFNDRLEKLNDQKQKLLSKMEDLQNSGENKWKDVRENILKMMENFEQSLSQYMPSP